MVFLINSLIFTPVKLRIVEKLRKVILVKGVRFSLGVKYQSYLS